MSELTSTLISTAALARCTGYGGALKPFKTVSSYFRQAHRAEALVITHIFAELPSLVLLTFSELAWKGLLAEETDAKGVFHTSPGRQPWVDGHETQGSAESATHGSSEAGRWPAINSKFTLTQGCRPGLYEPGLWPGANR